MCSLCCQQLQLPPLPLQRLRRLHLLLRAVVTPAIPFLRPHWHRRQFPRRSLHYKHQSRSREQCILPASTPTRIARAPPRASLSHQVCLPAGRTLRFRATGFAAFSPWRTKSELQQPVKSVRPVKYSFFFCYGTTSDICVRLDPLVLPSARKYWPLVTVRHVQTLVVTQTKVLSTQ